MREKRTIDDIARLAGVSKATVSRVLNHKPDVDPITRERILRIVEEQGFVPNITASNLAGGRSRLIGVLVPSFTWPFIPDIMRGVAEIVGKTTYELVLYSINDTLYEDDRGGIIDRILATKLTAGILAILPGSSVKHVARLHKHGFPIVLIDDQELPASIPWVGADYRKGAYTAVRHLIELGHRRIAHIQGPMKYLCSVERYEGYCQALEEEGLVPEPELIYEGQFLSPGGRSAANKFFQLPTHKRPTAIFAASDLMAYGVMAVAEEYGLHIPRDIALVGFDDLSSSAHVIPALTTVHQPFHEMGQRGIELLLSILERSRRSIMEEHRQMIGMIGVSNGRDGNDPIRIVLETSLVVRASCGSSHHLDQSKQKMRASDHS